MKGGRGSHFFNQTLKFPNSNANNRVTTWSIHLYNQQYIFTFVRLASYLLCFHLFLLDHQNTSMHLYLHGSTTQNDALIENVPYNNNFDTNKSVMREEKMSIISTHRRSNWQNLITSRQIRFLLEKNPLAASKGI